MRTEHAVVFSADKSPAFKNHDVFFAEQVVVLKTEFCRWPAIDPDSVWFVADGIENEFHSLRSGHPVGKGEMGISDHHAVKGPGFFVVLRLLWFGHGYLRGKG